jgi:membrane protein
MVSRSAEFRGFFLTARDYLSRGVKLFFDGQYLLFAQAIAFRVLITWVPLALLAMGFLGRLLSQSGPYQILQNFLASYFPTYQSERLATLVEELQRISGTLTIVGFVTLLYTTLTLFSTLRVAVANVFQQDYHRVRGITRGFAFDIQLMLQLGALFLGTVGLTIAGQFLDASGLEFVQRIGLSAEWMLSGWRKVAQFLSLVLPLGLSIGMFFQLYYFIPLPHPPRKSVFFGATLAALLWEVGKYFFTSYATGVNRYDTWASTVESDRIAMLGDVFGLLVAFVLWAYYSGLVLMIGGTAVMIHEARRRERLGNEVDDERGGR